METLPALEPGRVSFKMHLFIYCWVWVFFFFSLETPAGFYGLDGKIWRRLFFFFGGLSQAVG